RVFSTGSFVHGETILIESLGQEAGDFRIIFDNEHSHNGGTGSSTEANDRRSIDVPYEGVCLALVPRLATSQQEPAISGIFPITRWIGKRGSATSGMRGVKRLVSYRATRRIVLFGGRLRWRDTW